MLPEKIEDRYNAFYNAATTDNTLDQKTTVLIQLAAAMAIGCYP